MVELELLRWVAWASVAKDAATAIAILCLPIEVSVLIAIWLTRRK